MSNRDSASNYALDFEKPVNELENQIKELKGMSDRPGMDISKEISALQKKVDRLIKEIYGNLSSWERVQLSRHPLRPHTIDYIENIFSEFYEISGDRKFSDDQSVITGFAFLGKTPVAIVGIEKGRNTKEKILRNFGMPRPEGYRKAIRLMEMASQFNIPIVTLVDTPGAFPGIEAEERGQAEAIADNLQRMFNVKTPIVSLIIGEGGSGGALGVAIADKVLMLEYSIYSVISPESCASILWSDPGNAEKAANALKLDPNQALKLNVIDQIIPEPPGGAHRDIDLIFKNVQTAIKKELTALLKLDTETLLEDRYQKFRQMGNSTMFLDDNQ